MSQDDLLTEFLITPDTHYLDPFWKLLIFNLVILGAIIFTVTIIFKQKNLSKEKQVGLMAKAWAFAKALLKIYSVFDDLRFIGDP